MKKILFAGAAAVALTVSAGAQAADPIKLGLGGYSKWLFGYADQDDTFEGTRDYTNFDVKGDNEVFFKGSTKLDNGITVAIDVQLEAGGEAHSSPAATATTTAVGVPVAGARNDVNVVSNSATTATTTTRRGVTTTTYATTTTSTGEFASAGSVTAGGAADIIDESYITVGTGFGTFIVGSENNGAYLLHVTAPSAAGLSQDATHGLLSGAWVRNPGVTMVSTTAIDTDGDAEGITYVAPSFAGFTLGAVWKAGIDSASGDAHAMFDTNSTISNVFGVTGAYNGEFSGATLKLSAGYAVADVDGAGLDDHDEISLGGQFGYAGFTAGGGVRIINQDAVGGGDGASDGLAWALGLQYANGPYAVSVDYFTSELAGSAADADDDEVTNWNIGGRYTMGPGVNLIANVGYIEYDDEGTADNDGWSAITGLHLTF
ncbi:MAG: porin [Alphaproteobacteria bacterium]|nr:porin [Alphaproteobacteria bacterium]